MKRFLLAFGNNEFEDPVISPLRFAERDAQKLAGLFEYGARFDHVSSHYGRALSRDLIAREARSMTDRLRREGGGLLVVFAATHGTEHLGRHLLLCPQARVGDLDEFQGAVTVQKLLEWTAAPGVDRLLLLDSCRSPLQAGRDTADTGFQARSVRDLAAAPVQAGAAGGWQILCACGEGGRAHEVEALRRGLFSAALEEELADSLRQGRETLVDADFVERLAARMGQLATRHQLPAGQRPWLLQCGRPARLHGGGPAPAPIPVAPSQPSPPVSSPAKEEEKEASHAITLRLAEARRRADEAARETAQRTEAARAAAREAERRVESHKMNFKKLYPHYQDLLCESTATRGDRMESWAELCRGVGLPSTPPEPGELEWVGDTPTPKPLRFSWVTPSRPFANSLGMRFIPIPGCEGKVFGCLHPTRVMDYEALARSNPGWDGSWRNPMRGNTPITPFPDCPVVNVNHEDCRLFNQALAKLELAEARLGSHMSYRLPTDAEWSWMVGIGDKEGPGTPKEKSCKLQGVYPWGGQFPPPPGSGNYADQSAARAFGPEFGVIQGYDDGFPATSPVGTFKPNPHGFCDLGGNVWEWCEDSYDGKSGSRVLRGGSWYINFQDCLLASCRVNEDPDSRNDLSGFRCVLVVG